MAAITKVGDPTFSTVGVPPNCRLTGLVAGETLDQCDIVYIKGSDGKVYKATAAAANEASRAVGFAGEAASAGQPVTICRQGNVGYGSGMTPGTQVFLSAATAGLVVDAASAHAAHPIGFVFSAKKIYFDFSLFVQV